MHGMRRVQIALVVVGLCLALVTVGCSKSGTTEGTTAATPTSEEAEPRSSRPSRGEVACHLHSCAPPKYCNQDSGVCEYVACNDSRDCPYGYKCDFSKNVCQ
jgi:hypothetical protein